MSRRRLNLILVSGWRPNFCLASELESYARTTYVASVLQMSCDNES